MITVNSIGGATRTAAIVAANALAPKQDFTLSTDVSNDFAADISSSVAAYLSLPGFNSPAAASVAGAHGDAVAAVDRASVLAKTVAESDDGLKQALKQFDDGLKQLALRPETQIFQARFGADAAVDDNLPMPDPLPGVGEDGTLGVSSKEHQAADLDHDGKISEDERRRYQLPITYRSSERSSAALVDAPSAFSLAEANRAYGVVATAAA